VEKALDRGDAAKGFKLLKSMGMLEPIADRTTEEDEVVLQRKLDKKLRRSAMRKAAINMRADIGSARTAEEMLSGKNSPMKMNRRRLKAAGF
jgi:hypothetical protein